MISTLRILPGRWVTALQWPDGSFGWAYVSLDAQWLQIEQVGGAAIPYAAVALPDGMRYLSAAAAPGGLVCCCGQGQDTGQLQIARAGVLLRSQGNCLSKPAIRRTVGGWEIAVARTADRYDRLWVPDIGDVDLRSSGLIRDGAGGSGLVDWDSAGEPIAGAHHYQAALPDGRALLRYQECPGVLVGQPTTGGGLGAWINESIYCTIESQRLANTPSVAGDSRRFAVATVGGASWDEVWMAVCEPPFTHEPVPTPPAIVDEPLIPPDVPTYPAPKWIGWWKQYGHETAMFHPANPEAPGNCTICGGADLDLVPLDFPIIISCGDAHREAVVPSWSRLVALLAYADITDPVECRAEIERQTTEAGAWMKARGLPRRPIMSYTAGNIVQAEGVDWVGLMAYFGEPLTNEAWDAWWADARQRAGDRPIALISQACARLMPAWTLRPNALANLQRHFAATLREDRVRGVFPFAWARGNTMYPDGAIWKPDVAAWYAAMLAATPGRPTIEDTTPIVAPPPYTVAILASAATIQAGQPVQVAWYSTDATSATLDGRPVEPNGSMIVTPMTSHDYRVAVTGAGGQAGAVCTVVVMAAPATKKKSWLSWD